MQLSEKHIKEFKEIYKKEYDKDLSDQEAFESAHNLVGFVSVIYDGWVMDQKRKKKLESSPKGFHLDGIGYTCFICGNSVSNEQTWYDKHGIKCLTCQKSIDKKEIPASLASDKESWYSKYDLENCFCLKGAMLRSWIKSGILKARTVTNNGKGVHVQLFLIKDNKVFLPPKKLVKGQMVKEVRDGKDWYYVEPWYRFGDPFEHLKGYEIMKHLRLVCTEESDTPSSK